jgi:hypothetical protein
MMRIPLYHLDAFSHRPFGGNLAAFCVVADWPSESLMQRIAAENNLSETVFLRPGDGAFDLRWFSPTHEVDLSGHAGGGLRRADPPPFGPASRPLRDAKRPLGGVRQRLVALSSDPAHLSARSGGGTTGRSRRGLGAEIETVLHAVKNFYVVLPDEAAIRDLRPDLGRLRRLHPNGVSVSAPGTTTDFVSRYFAPSYGIPEDPSPAIPTAHWCHTGRADWVGIICGHGSCRLGPETSTASSRETVW